MTFECRHMLRGMCQKRHKPCAPGDPGCVIFGQYETPMNDQGRKRKRRSRPEKVKVSPSSVASSG